MERQNGQTCARKKRCAAVGRRDTSWQTRRSRNKCLRACSSLPPTTRSLATVVLKHQRSTRTVASCCPPWWLISRAELSFDAWIGGTKRSASMYRGCDPERARCHVCVELGEGKRACRKSCRTSTTRQKKQQRVYMYLSPYQYSSSSPPPFFLFLFLVPPFCTVLYLMSASTELKNRGSASKLAAEYPSLILPCVFATYNLQYRTLQ